MKKVLNGYEVVEVLNQLAPKKFAEDWDNVGLLVGTLNKKITNVLVTLDVTDEVVEEAINKNIDLIVAHHPLIFKPLKNVTTDTLVGHLVNKLIKNDISVFALHTNLDVAEGGVNSYLSSALSLKNIENLTTTYEESLLKLVVYTPKTHAEVVAKAMGDAGAGSIGEYSHCVFKTEGVGEFLPLKNSNAYIGEVGKLERVQEIRIETIISEKDKNKILNAMLKAHPYEEVAYDLYKVEQKGESFGLGKIGYLENKLSLEEFAKKVKNDLNMPFVKLIGDKNSLVKKVAIVGGSGSSFITASKNKGADVFITGDITYHTALDAKEENFNIIDAGHYIEHIMVKNLAQYMQSKLAYVNIFESEINTNPYEIIV